MSVLDAPELAPYRDEPAQMPSGAPGKHGVLDMSFARRGDRSVLAHLHRKAPLLVQQALYWDEHLPGLPCVYIITTSGCVLQGDRLDVSITVGAGAMAHVTTQSATKIHQMDANFAAASQRLALAENAYLELLPGPVIPHRHSRFITCTRATVADSATLLSAELLQPGRKHHGAGELFEFDLYSSTLTASRPDGTQLFTEKLVAEPWQHPVRRAGVMGKFDVFANVTLVTPTRHADQIFERVVPGADADCVAGASRLPNDAGLVYKVLGMETEPVKAKVRAFWDLVRQQVLGTPVPAARPWGPPLLPDAAGEELRYAQRRGYSAARSRCVSPHADRWSGMNAGDTAWVLVSTALVMVMLPGLAFFYGGLVSSRNVLVMLQQNIFPLGLVSVLWVLAGFSLAFGPDAGGGVIGNLAAFGLRDLAQGPLAGMHAVVPGVAIPGLVFVAYMMMFAIITPALITGATADRLKFAGYAVVLGLWSLIVYAPVAHWLFSPSGWLARRGAQDWAGGLVVHATAGAGVLALLLVVGRRRRWPDAATRPHSVPLAVLGAGLLWFGWFGFNGADGLRADGVAAQAVINTQVAAAAAMLVWLLVERFTDGHSTVLGAVTGAVAGLATITPCAGFADTYAAIVLGGLAGLICHLALRLKQFLRFDDALDVVAVHFVGGVLGTLLLGFFGDKNVNPIGANGLFYGGGGRLLGEQALATVVVVAFSFGVTWVIAAAVARTIGLRVLPAYENDLDRTQEALSAYALGRQAGAPQPVDGDTAEPVMPMAPVSGQMKLVRSLVDHEDLDELRATLVEAGAVQIVLSEASLYTPAPRTEVFRGQRRKIAFDPRLRLEVTVPEPDVQRVVQAIRRIPGISTYLQVIDASLTAAVAGRHGGNGAGEQGQGDPPVPGEAPARPRS